MTLPSPATKTNLDGSTDDPKLARPELADLVEKFNALLTHHGLSTILSTPLTVGSGLVNNSGALDVRTSSTTQTGIAELATDAEAAAKTDTARVMTPSNLAALGASDTFAGLIEIATNAEALTGTDTSRAITPSNLAHVLANSGSSIKVIRRQVKTSSGTYTPDPYLIVAEVELVGGGGGSGSGNVGTNGRGGGGGGSGGTAKGVFSAASIGASQSVTIGSGGAAASNGGNSSFGSLMTANGGTGGANGGTGTGGTGGTGGTASGGTYFNLTGGNGGDGSGYYNATYGISFTFAGSGGATPLGTTALGNAAIAGIPNTGAGASGSRTSTGASGGAGICIIIEYCSQ